MFDFRFILTRFQKKALEKALSVARNLGQYTVTNRIRSILAIAEGKGVGEIASILRVSPATIRQWLTKYLTGGLKALRTVHKQSGRFSRLTKTQKRQLKQWITDGPQCVGFPGACWRSPMIQELISQKFGVFYSVKYISQLLKNLGFSYQKARFSVGGKDPDNQRKREDWLSKTWSEILNQAEKENAYLLFGDEVSFPQWGSLTYTWAPKGQQPTVQTSGCRKGYKVFGLIDYFTGKFFYKTLEGRFNSESYKDFLWGVLLKTRKKIILVQDGARYHTSKAMRLFFDQFKHRVTVYQLPSYSPDYNPIEKLWKNIKTAEIHLHYFPTFDSLKQKVEEALLRHSNRQKEICNLFGFYHEIKVA
jgi:transposase